MEILHPFVGEKTHRLFFDLVCGKNQSGPIDNSVIATISTYQQSIPSPKHLRKRRRVWMPSTLLLMLEYWTSLRVGLTARKRAIGEDKVWFLRRDLPQTVAARNTLAIGDVNLWSISIRISAASLKSAHILGRKCLIQK